MNKKSALFIGILFFFISAFDFNLSNKNLQKLSFISTLTSISFIAKKGLHGLSKLKNAKRIYKKWDMFNELTIVYYSDNHIDTFVNLP